MPLQTYHVTSTAGAQRIFFGSDHVSGWPIQYAGPIPRNTEFAYDPHGPTMHRLFVLSNTHVAAGSGSIKRGSAANFGHQTRYSRNGMGIAGQENQ